MTAWHVGDELARRYAANTAAETDAWSLEKHVESCAHCAARVSAAVRGRGAAAPLLTEIRTAVLAAAKADPVREAPRLPGPASRLGRVLWAAGPALRGAWAGALLLVAFGAVALAYVGGLGGAARPLLLVVAPVLPLAGVGVSYGRHADPMHEIATTTPGGGLRLLLVRTAAVLAVAVPVLTLAGAALPSSAGGPGAVAWLLPGLAMTLGALALGSYVGCRTGASSVAVCWTAAVILPAFGTSPSRIFDATEPASRYLAGTAAQSGWAAAAVLCAGLLALRRRSFDHLEKS
ncbi:hypothetical protein ACIBM4_03900 [Streptomyces sp. NPDC050256]|uniref:hypothetical protein n=1 Tax=unclassified Streptomyces TaxID=2593676 RepID=UPI0037AEB1EC